MTKQSDKKIIKWFKEEYPNMLDKISTIEESLRGYAVSILQEDEENDLNYGYDPDIDEDEARSGYLRKQVAKWINKPQSLSLEKARNIILDR
jgi:type IV secretory pathway VirB4 component